jgi:hypothetical protein
MPALARRFFEKAAKFSLPGSLDSNFSFFIEALEVF